VIDLDVAANMIGRHNAQRAARQVFGAMQIRLLNLHIILTVLDEVSEVRELLVRVHLTLIGASRSLQIFAALLDGETTE
jgi:hypothetical protein